MKEEITTVNQSTPDNTIQRTTRVVEPAVRGEAPQKVFEKKKTIVRSNQIVWYILGLVEVLLAFRVVLKMLGANPYVGFTDLIYSITLPLVTPFNGIIGLSGTGSSVFEWSTIIAGLVYLCVGWGLSYLLNMLYPITPKDIEA